SARGPEAGVWVIAETNDLPTRFIKIVVTDEQGRYVLPELPKGANYDVWVRGYGLVDSPKVKGAPGRILNLSAVVAPNEAAAADYLPGAVVALHAEDSGQEPVPRHRTRRQWHAAADPKSEPMACRDQVARLRLLSPDGQQADPQDCREPRQIRLLLRGLDASAAGWPGG